MMGMDKLLYKEEGPKLIFDLEAGEYVVDERNGTPAWELWVFIEAWSLTSLDWYEGFYTMENEYTMV